MEDPEITVLEALHSTPARRYLSPQPIGDDIIRKLLDAAIRGPNGGNTQRWAWIVLRDPEVKAQIAAFYREGWEKLYGVHREFMLAQPEEDPAEIIAALGAGALADDKYDGIRAQIHADASGVRIYSRTMDDVTHRFPEVEAAARELGHGVILDGEMVAFSDRRRSDL